MLQLIETINNAVNNFIWGVPAMICIFGVGLYLSLRTRFLQIRKFPYAIRTTLGRMFRKRDASDGAITPFQAVCTALAATVGTGNIAGVAGAIAIGGPGAVFWMWVSALLGARLHLVYDYRRQRNENICKNIGGNDIVFLVSDSVLYFFVINDISDHHIKRFYRNSIDFFVFLNRRNRTRIEFPAFPCTLRGPFADPLSVRLPPARALCECASNVISTSSVSKYLLFSYALYYSPILFCCQVIFLFFLFKVRYFYDIPVSTPQELRPDRAGARPALPR